jgi:hypothetical protein
MAAASTPKCAWTGLAALGALLLVAGCSGSCEGDFAAPDHSVPPPRAERTPPPEAEEPVAAPADEAPVLEEAVADEDDPYGGLPAVPAPEGLPRDVPNFAAVPGKDTRIVAALSRPGEGQAMTLRSHEPPEDIFAYYRDELQQEGWQIESELERPRQRMLRSTKGNRSVSVTIITNKEGDLSQVMVVAGRGPGVALPSP